jgi:hypothetical protein
MKAPPKVALVPTNPVKRLEYGEDGWIINYG